MNSNVCEVDRVPSQNTFNTLKPIPSTPPLYKRVSDVAIRIFNDMYENVTGVRLGIAATRYTLKTAREIYPRFGRRLGSSIGALGCAAIYSIMKTPKHTVMALQATRESFALGDKEGVFFGSLDAGQALGNGLDSAIVINYSLKEILDFFHHSVITVPEIFAKIFLPLDLALTAVDILTQGVTIYRTHELLQKVESGKMSVKSRPGSAIIKEIKLKLNESNPAEVEKREIIRHSSEKVFNAIQSGSYKDEVKAFLHRKLNIDIANETVNIITFLALCTFLITAIAPYVGLGILSLLAIFKLVMYVKENSYLYKESPHLI